MPCSVRQGQQSLSGLNFVVCKVDYLELGEDMLAGAAVDLQRTQIVDEVATKIEDLDVLENVQFDSGEFS